MSSGSRSTVASTRAIQPERLFVTDCLLWDAHAVQRALSRAGERFSTLADVFRNPQLRRLELSWAGFYVGEWTYFVALSVYAFEVGGAAALGALGLARMIPAAIALPFGSLLTDRYARQRVLLGIHAGRALLFGRDGRGAGGGELARRSSSLWRRWQRSPALPSARRRSRSCRHLLGRRGSSWRQTSPRARWKGWARSSARCSAACSRRRQAWRSPLPSAGRRQRRLRGVRRGNPS